MSRHEMLRVLCLAVLTLTGIDLSARTAEVCPTSIAPQPLLSGLPDSPIVPEYESGVFTENRGQWDAEARFLLRREGLDLWITDRGAVFDIYRTDRITTSAGSIVPRFAEASNPFPGPDYSDVGQEARTRGAVIRMTFERTAPEASATGIDDGGINRRTNYFIGSPDSWRSDCRSYSGIRIEGLYKGIDATFYLDRGFPRYDFHLAAGADVSLIRYRFEGIRDLCVDEGGGLVLMTGAGEVEMRDLYAYQVGSDGTRTSIPCHFSVSSTGEVGFVPGPYDRSRALIIDPLVYSTAFGGSSLDRGEGLALTAEGTVWISGTTSSSDLPITPGAYDTVRGRNDIFVAHFDPTAPVASQLIYSTFLGGSEREEASTLALDPDGGVWISAHTQSPDYPTTLHAFDTATSGNVVVTRLSPLDTGIGQLSYSTYLGGARDEVSTTLAAGQDGTVWVGGYTASIDFPRSIDAFDTSYGGGSDAFLCRLDPSERGPSQLTYSSLFGSEEGELITSLIVLPDSSVWAGGYTRSPDFPTTPGAFDNTFGGTDDTFIMHVDASATGSEQLQYSTLFGGSGPDEAGDILLGQDGTIWVCGLTESTDYPTTSNAYDREYDDWNDVFLAHLDPSAEGSTQLLYSTLLGGMGHDRPTGLALGVGGTVWICGETRSIDFPTTPNSYDTSHGGDYDVFVTGIDPQNLESRQLVYSTYLGGTGYDGGGPMTRSSEGIFYITGFAARSSFPTTQGAYDETFDTRDPETVFLALLRETTSDIPEYSRTPLKLWLSDR